MSKTQTNELEVGTQFIFNAEPSTLETARMAAIEGLGRVIEHVQLETRMLVFDAFHGTNYRQIRHELVEQQRRERFEARIGLVAVDRK